MLRQMKRIYLTLVSCTNAIMWPNLCELRFSPDNIAHNGGFKPNYPLLFPKFTIKLSIKTGSDSSSSPSTEAAELHQNPSVSRQEKGTRQIRQQTDGQTHPPPVTPGSSARVLFLEPRKQAATRGTQVFMCSFNSQRSPQFVTPHPWL